MHQWIKPRPHKQKLPDLTSDFAKYYRILRNQPFTFTKREYIEKIYDDDAKTIAVTKGRQTELTEYLANWLIHNLARYANTIGLYISDRHSHTSEFSNLRIRDWCLKPSIALDEYVSWKDHTATVLNFKNGSKLFMHSAYGGFEEARSIPVDFAAVDEIQSTKVGELDVLKQTLSHSQYGFLRLVGTGSDEGSEWNKLWKEGTQYEWKNDKWVAKNPGATMHSYHVPQLITPWFDKKEAESVRRRNERRYVTEILGWWYRGAKKPITDEEMFALFDKNYHMLTPGEVDRTLGPVVMGIDYGGGETAFTVPWIEQIIDQQNDIARLIFTQRIEERSTEKQADMIIHLIDGYNPDQVVMDAGGGPRQVEKVEQRFGWRTVKEYYMERPEEPIEEDKLVSDNLLKVDRSWAIGNIIDQVTRPLIIHNKTQNRIILPGQDIKELEWVVDHYTNVMAKTVELQSGRSYTRFVKEDPLEADDAIHAKGYANSAWYLYKRRQSYGEDLQGFQL